MNNWEHYYNEHCITVDEAVALVRSGDLIIDGHGHGRSPIFGPALMKRANELHDVKLTTGYNLTPSVHCNPEYEGSFRHISIFNVAETRRAHWEGRASFAAANFSQLERVFKSWKPRILFTQVTPPDKNGNVSMGVSVDFTRAMVDEVELVIAQVNRNMPWLNGDAVIPVTKIHAFVECDTDLPEIPEITNVSATDRAIAEHIATLIEDNDCLQTGVGAIPDTVLQFLTNHKHLGVHTELCSTGIMRLLEKGIVDNSQKSHNKGKVVCTMLGGTREFYDYVSHNEDFITRKSSYVLNPAVISQNRQVVAMNSAIQLDLYGQVCSEMIAGKQYSGVGGQLDFLRGAMMSEGGKSIICMPSTASKGTVSRIVATLSQGSVVTDTRNDVMYVVTEYGVADLWGKDNDERARQLINISHPKFREDLERDFWNKIHKVV